ncbi:transposase [Corynebacterium diphtheriae]|nr:transposase [Corynebacterium diphtheriae]
MNDLVATLGINNLSKSQVSDMAKDLDEIVEDLVKSGEVVYLSFLNRWIGGDSVRVGVRVRLGVDVGSIRRLPRWCLRRWRGW